MVRLAAVGLILLAGVGGWALWPASPGPAAAEDPAENGRDAAFHRWESSQPSHWRYVVMSRD